MKKIILKSVFALSSLMFISSCQKDEPAPKPQCEIDNTFEIQIQNKTLNSFDIFLNVNGNATFVSTVEAGKTFIDAKVNPGSYEFYFINNSDNNDVRTTTQTGQHCDVRKVYIQ